MSLFGGAITLAVPPSHTDASVFREVPDNQEVFVSTTDNSSLIVELLEMERDQQDWALFHFIELASDNDAALPADAIVARTQLQLLPSMNLPSDSSIAIIHGLQFSAKFNKTEKDRVHIFLAVVRIPTVQTDLLISVNRPVDAETSEVNNESALLDFCKLVNTIRVNDWGLFQ
ncbi:Mog1p/PsbP-like protein [Rhizoclosmatium globosum]|uniref:Mog1p/PsbP-like protein n=1 Tax=Rhizoclosmatium globosum TaxID=329046 RepID=A0A1Y2C3Z2_9FUNG|nr:Mog1p/PsbP-like protein [Rhizoclosmatium globosum]|eukprot:ORY41607.1 Mog1p/PsbP-like protein [Rhizoclosmatium globosum]